ncbi:MAG: hypothetical protein ACOVRK_07540 [Chryseobacterium taeanense]|jgi:hypothetical protein
MKDNGYYKIEDTPEGNKKITLFHGCIVDYEILIREIIGSTVLLHKDLELEKPKQAWSNNNDRIKVNRTTTIEIKTIEKIRIRKLRAFK